MLNDIAWDYARRCGVLRGNVLAAIHYLQNGLQDEAMRVLRDTLETDSKTWNSDLPEASRASHHS
jgi:hypothetical protein